MAQIPPYQLPDPVAPPPKKSNAVLWVIAIVVLGGMCLALVVMAAILFPVFSQAKLAAQTTSCLSNMKLQATGMALYTTDFDDRFPPAEGWNGRIEPYNSRGKEMQCPVAKAEDGPDAIGYAFNSAIASIKSSDIASAQGTILLFESQDSALGKFGGENDLKSPGRHHKAAGLGNNYAYCDTQAKFVRDTDDPGLWKP